MGSFDSRYGPMTCEYGNDPSVYMKAVEFIERVDEYIILKTAFGTSS